eukprot:gene23766-biopygen11859
MPGGAHGEPWTPPVHRPILASAVDGSTRLGRGWRPAARRRQAPPVESAETRAEALQNPRNQQPAEKKRARVARASPRSAPGADSLVMLAGKNRGKGVLQNNPSMVFLGKKKEEKNRGTYFKMPCMRVAEEQERQLRHAVRGSSDARRRVHVQ